MVSFSVNFYLRTQVIYPERAEIKWDTVEGILKLANMYEMGSVS